MKYFSAALTAAFIFINTFANCFHSHHLEECISVKSSCTMENQLARIIAASGEHKDFDGDCPACSYLLSAQGAYFDSIILPEKHASSRYSVAGQDSFHNYLCFENPARAPPYFSV
jgi:hypothetical protein